MKQELSIHSWCAAVVILICVGVFCLCPAGAYAAPLAAGTYTVSANIWVDRSDSGLPLNVHLTSNAFPPMDPSQSNAIAYVDEENHTWVRLPITIQPNIMTLRSIEGLDLVGEEAAGATGADDVSGAADEDAADNGISSLTIDLGILTSDDAVMRSCTVQVTAGSMALSLAGNALDNTPDHTWPATLEMDFTGTAASGGGEVPQVVKDMALGASPTSSSAAALAALDAAEDAGATSHAVSPSRMPIVIGIAGATLVALVAVIVLVVRVRRRSRAA